MIEVSDKEFEVLEAIWQGAPVSANEVVGRLNKKNEWHDKTVKTLLGRMVKKGAITFEREGRSYLYSPCLARQEYVQKQSAGLVERMFDGKIGDFVAGFASSKKLKPSDIEELKAFIDKWEKEND
ncbi:BlaI/MecI/CopY family transcriptional regulator [Microbulbifer sp. CAU 1566]|uniref:BlaI/MecI/CopY family transcriptional regulator n=1 Tax=Microbulbifer sp. CAU 1566 TaxID=2933269 RepID=UPI0020040C65|nr:BlaI/MecI/CopY family transcriptional regulator [Microbulbifer sp. CAU 1566]MCK7597960.1 BlaI/MecI/CopY family transcriptional regulator [Microbulbifer sp. CAU 1566]